jgi:aldehyde dehydrogenase (NAD+)
MNPFQDLFDAQKAYFATNVTRTYKWRVEQLDRMGRMIKKNEAAVQNAASTGTAGRKYIFETVTSIETETVFPKAVVLISSRGARPACRR